MLAIGRNVISALGIERAFGVPAGGVIGYDPTLPVVAGLGGTEFETAQVQRTGAGFPSSGLPGLRGGAPQQMGHPLTTAHLLEFLQHLLGANVADGSLVKTNPEAGVWRYQFEPAPIDTALWTSLWGFGGVPPVERHLLYGIRFASLALQTTPTAELTARLDGFSQHGSRFSAVAPALANTGTYDLGPHLRGLALDESLGGLWFLVESLAPLTFKALQAVAEPDAAAWMAAATTFQVVVDAAGEARWQTALSSADGFDLGVYAENKDPLEVIWPGTAAEHADLVVGDVFGFAAPGWPTPALATVAAGMRYTMAHLGLTVDGEEVAVKQATLTLDHPLEVVRGNNSRYPTEIDRTGEPTFEIQLQRDFTDRRFASAHDLQAPVALDFSFSGRQLSAAWRETLQLTVAAAKVTADERPASAAGKVQEQVTLQAQVPDNGDPAIAYEVVTDRDWTPAS
jgi:hypothetical protein